MMEQGDDVAGPSRQISNSGLERNFQETYNIWNTLPDSVRQDPLFDSFHRIHKGGQQSAQQTSCTLRSNGTSRKKRSLTFDGDISKLNKRKLPIVPKIIITNMNGDTTSLSPDSDDLFTNHFKTSSDHATSGETEGGDELDTSTFPQSWAHYTKMTFLICIWSISVVILMLVKRDSDINNAHQISVPPNVVRSYWIRQKPTMQHVRVELEGAILPTYYANLTTKYIKVWLDLIQIRYPNSNLSENSIFYRKTISSDWIVPIVSEDAIDFAPEVRQTKLFDITDLEWEMVRDSLMCLQFNTNLAASFPISVSYDLAPINPEDGIVYAALILSGLYFLIITEIVHRTVAAMFAATVSVAALTMFGERPSHQEIVSWVDLETLTLLFSMMVFVAIFSETGVFDYLAVLAYRISCYLTATYRVFQWLGGRTWMLINILCLNTVLVSLFLDNVTTILLMTPVTIRLCEVMKLNPIPVLMAMIVFSNIGGAITPIGDPPNVIIASNKDVISSGVSFIVFSLNMGIPLIIIMVLVHIQLRYMFRNMKNLQYRDPKDVQDLRHEIVIWQRTAASLSSYTKEEDYVRETLMKKVRRLLFDLKKKLLTGSVILENFEENIEELSRKFPIRDKVLLFKSSSSLLFVIITFFLQSVLNLHLSMGSIALLGALLLLLLDREDIVNILARVEWSTLIFFTSLFILMEGLSRLGLIDFIGDQTEMVIKAVPPNYRLVAAILLILWVSGFASSCLDNIPLTTMMIRIAVNLSQSEHLQLPLQPLVWALALGACLGGNGTLIGSSSNLVCACVAERHGHKFTFMEFSKIGFPVMMWSMFVATIYLMIRYVWFGIN